MARAYGFGWHRLRSTDPVTAAEFYVGLLGWSAIENLAGFTFRDDQGRGVAGLTLTEPGSPPRWTPYLAVSDLDAALAEFGALNGASTGQPSDSEIPPGRLAEAAHPAIGAVTLFEGSAAVDSPAGFGWHQLDTPDPASAAELLGSFAGWTPKPTALEGATVLGEVGTTFNGVTVTATPNATIPTWLSYVRVPRLRDVIRRAAELGALVVTEQTLIPPVGPACVIRDFDGLAIACYEPGTPR